MTAPKPKTKPTSAELVYNFIVKAKCEVPTVAVRPEGLTFGTIESMLKRLIEEGALVRRQVRDKPKGRAFWVYRQLDTPLNPEYVDASDPSVVSIPKKRPPRKEKESTSADYKEIIKEEPSNHKILRDLPKGSEQVVPELYLSDYYDTSSPNFLKDHRPMKGTLTPDASSNIVQIIRDASQLQKITAASPPDWVAINSLAQSLLISATGLMRDSLSNIWSEHDRK